jgi:hypothetical protein
MSRFCMLPLTPLLESHRKYCVFSAIAPHIYPGVHRSEIRRRPRHLRVGACYNLHRNLTIRLFYFYFTLHLHHLPFTRSSNAAVPPREVLASPQAGSLSGPPLLAPAALPARHSHDSAAAAGCSNPPLASFAVWQATHALFISQQPAMWARLSTAALRTAWGRRCGRRRGKDHNGANNAPPPLFTPPKTPRLYA